MSWRKRIRGTPRQIGKAFRAIPKVGKMKARLPKIAIPTMFYQATGKYSDIVKISSPEEANESVRMLHKEFMNAKTREKQSHIIKSAVLASNRAGAFLEKRDTKPKTKLEMVRVRKIYRDFADKMITSSYRIEKR